MGQKFRHGFRHTLGSLLQRLSTWTRFLFGGSTSKTSTSKLVTLLGCVALCISSNLQSFGSHILSILVSLSSSVRLPLCVCKHMPFFFFFWPHCAAYRILVPDQGIEPMPPAVEVQSPNHWTTRELPSFFSFVKLLKV